MKIELKEIRVFDLVDGYADNGENGVVGYGGKLDIRPSYQREFVYKDDKRNAVIDTVLKSFPLNVMYWVQKDDGNFEILDGQQRTISICQYIQNEFKIDGKTYDNLPKDIQKKIDDYKLMVYLCTGTPSEKLDWFRTINIAGEKLSEQELRNATYTGPWLTSAKKHFSKLGCPAQKAGGHLLVGNVNRQHYLETALKWVSNEKIEDYMSDYQHKKDADDLWQYFQDVINWVAKVFTIKRGEMKGLDWGALYNKYHTQKYNSNDIEAKIQSLMEDDEVTSKRGIFEYVLSGNPRSLSLRAFSDKDKSQAFAKQMVAGTGKATCKLCTDKTKLFSFNEMEADHAIPWSRGGKTTIDNCQMLCRACNNLKSNH